MLLLSAPCKSLSQQGQENFIKDNIMADVFRLQWLLRATLHSRAGTVWPNVSHKSPGAADTTIMTSVCENNNFTVQRTFEQRRLCLGARLKPLFSLRHFKTHVWPRPLTFFSVSVSVCPQAVRVTKPNIPESIRRNYELMWVLLSSDPWRPPSVFSFAP